MQQSQWWEELLYTGFHWMDLSSVIFAQRSMGAFSFLPKIPFMSWNIMYVYLGNRRVIIEISYRKKGGLELAVLVKRRIIPNG
jgi:hypothetical protein